MRVLIVPDKFKGTLTAREAAEAIAAGWRRARPSDELDLLPMSDGGDGFGEIVGGLLGAEAKVTATINAALQPVQATWWWASGTRTAVIESARVVGLAMLPRGKFHPFELDTLGLGQLLASILSEHQPAEVIVGIGGSATNDGGFGMARGLGYRFLDQAGEIVRWTALHNLSRIDAPQMGRVSLLIATDVQNPLLGPEGATRIYGPQKGLRPEDFPAAEACLSRLAETVRRDLKIDAANEPGTGAAGGLGYGLRVFFHGRFEPGFDIFARLARLKEHIGRADLVVTGEGAIDSSTFMGKGTGAVAQLARQAGKECIGFAGAASGGGSLFRAVHALSSRFSIEEAMSRPGNCLEELAAAVAKNADD